jgi:hypothetical protein
MSYAKRIRYLILAIVTAAPFVTLVNTSQAAVLLEENFDDSSYADTGWTLWLQGTDCMTGTSATINPSAAYRGSNGFDIHYVLQPNSDGGCLQHQDNNTSLVHTFSPSLNHYFVRGYFRFPIDTATLCSQRTIQRKLIYLKPEGWGNGAWAFMINSWPWPNCATDGYNVSVGYQGGGGTGATLWGNNPPDGFQTADNHLYVNTWYYIEIEVEYRAYGNDTLRIWLAQAGSLPKLILDRSDLNLRSSTDAASGIALGSVEIGRQVDINRNPDFTPLVDEHRHWDEIAIGNTRIGPIDGSGGDTLPPAAPTNLTVQ